METPPFSKDKRASHHAEFSQLQARAKLALAGRIADEVLLDQLVALGITPETLLALSLIPLVEVAWADGKIEDSEKCAILTVLREIGLAPESQGYRLIEGCLDKPPHPRLRGMWEHYVKVVSASQSPEQMEILRREWLQAAERVAEAAGDSLGGGSNVSVQEQELLARLASAFSGAVRR